ncbi:MAG: hypothetical protein QXJ68_07035 [Methanocellales archaeon]
MKNKLFGSEEAISVVVSAILMFGIAVGILAIVNTSYIPAWKKDAEAEHMQAVKKDFSILKSNIEKVAAANINSTSTTIQMGSSNSLPFLGSTSSSGSLEIDSESGSFTISRNTTIADLSITYSSKTNNDFPLTIRNVTELKKLEVIVTYMSGTNAAFKLTIAEGRNHEVVFSRVSDTRGLTINVDGTRVYYAPYYFSGSGNAYSPLTFDILAFLPDIKYPPNPINLEFNRIDGNSRITTSIKGSNISAYSRVITDLNLTRVGNIKYFSHNNYWINQKLVYENGALIINQDNRSTMRLPPIITISKLNEVNISVDVHAIVLAGKSSSLSSSSMEEIRTSTISNQNILKSEYFNAKSIAISIKTDYPQAWEQYLAAQCAGANLTSPNQFETSITEDKVTLLINGTVFEQSSNVLDIRLNIAMSIVEIDIGSIA